MTVGHRVETSSGVSVAESAAKTAAELTLVVREASRDLAFGIEPASFLVVLETLADTSGNDQ